MAGVARDELRRLHHASLHIGHQNPPQARNLIQHLHEIVGPDAQSFAWDLNDASVGRATRSEHDRQANKVL